MRRMRGTERDGNGLLPLPLTPGTTASSPHPLSKKATETPDDSRGGEENASVKPSPPPPEQNTAVVTAEVSASEPPAICGENGVVVDNHKSDGETQVLKETRQGVAIESIGSCEGNGLEVSRESPGKGGAARRVAAAVPEEPAVEIRNGVETVELRNGVEAVEIRHGEEAVEIRNGVGTGQRPEIGQGTSGVGTGGDAGRRRTSGRGCGGCVVG